MVKGRAGATGFTLLELIIVLFIIGLVCGFSTVFITKGLPSARLNATVRELSATIRHARSLAVLKGETQTMVIDAEAQQYGIEGYPRKRFPADVIVRTIDPVTGEATDKSRLMRFEPGGVFEGAGIWLENKTTTVRIDTDPIAGVVAAKSTVER